VSGPEEPPPSHREDAGHRLDPDLAAARARAGAESGEQAGVSSGEPHAPAVGPEAPPFPSGALPGPRSTARRYGWQIGIFALVVVVIVSIYQFVTNGIGTTGVAAGQRLRAFAAPLANSTLEGDANVTNPTCSLARHDPRVLNSCLILRRRPLVLSFFVTGSSSCVSQVDALQRLSKEAPGGSVQFAAVAIHASHSATRALVRSHHWTIPVAYDASGAVQGAYSLEICPIAELVRRGGVVASRLVGDRYQTGTELAPAVRALIAGSRPSTGG
jgi:hypothetical protein